MDGVEQTGIGEPDAMIDKPAVRYVCKYTPIELLAGFGCRTAVLDGRVDDFDLADQVAHPNLCGFGRAVVQKALAGGVDELVLVNCCDVMRRVYDIVLASGRCRFLYMMDLPHKDGCCQIDDLARSIRRLGDAYASFSGATFDPDAFEAAFAQREQVDGPYIGVLGARAGHELVEQAEDALPLPVRDLTCVGARDVERTDVFPEDAGQTAAVHAEARATRDAASGDDGGDDARATRDAASGDDGGDVARTAVAWGNDALIARYAAALLRQTPCRRMEEHAGRRSLTEDPNLRGIVYHTIRFCDYYGGEYDELQRRIGVPLLKVETDYTRSSGEQLRTRFEAFAETFGGGARAYGGNGCKTRGANDRRQEKDMVSMAASYVAGIDSGSASTDVVVLDRDRHIVTSRVIPTGGGARMSAERCLDEALEVHGIPRAEVGCIVTTGYGRDYVDAGQDSVTEITCHAKGAHFLDGSVRTIIDIGGQDSKAIRIDDEGAVQDFAMNDKCAAGTGRFLEKTADALGLTLPQMSAQGLEWKHDVTISSTCTVFAESEVVTLVARNVAVPDIVHGLDKAIASKTAALVGRVKPVGAYMMTGGVARNAGVVKALEERLGIKLIICEEAQIAGALGAALIAADRAEMRGLASERGAAQ